MKAMVRSFGVLVLAVAVGVSGCSKGEATPQASDASGGPSGGMGRRGQPRVSAVQTVPVTVGSIARSVTVSGVVEPLRTVAVNSQLSGQVLAVNVEEGTVVHTGDTLAELDGRELQAQLAAAEAAYQVAEAAFERAQQLRDRQIITLPEYEQQRTAHAAAKATLDQIRTRIGYTHVLSPVNGVVTEKRVEAGDAVGTQTRLFSVAEVATLVVRVGVSELDVVELKEGDPVQVDLDAFPGRAVSAHIRRIFPTGDPTTRLVPVEVALESSARSFVRPGFLARTTFALNQRTGVLLIPQGALVGGSSSQAVFVVEQGRAVRRTVETGLMSEGAVEVVSGLEKGEPVVTLGNNLLRDGAEVRVVNGDTAEVEGGGDTAASAGGSDAAASDAGTPAAGSAGGAAK
ncbi:MAG: efflux RND transporter periplasmic adaptor subunit [Gemmatimonadetes bacterium]|nr:efflux RND transporter periplasmic adaptor subunit [Gemmatimonadota bacterium]